MLLVSRKRLLGSEKDVFTKGVGIHDAELRSFELALRDAGIEKCNLVRVSSILPPDCKVISKNEGMKDIVPGMLTFCVMARCSSNEPHRLIAASIGCAVPADPTAYGVMSYDRKHKTLYIYHELYKYALNNWDLYKAIASENIKNDYIRGDSAEPRTINELNQYGLRVSGVKKGPDTVEIW